MGSEQNQQKTKYCKWKLNKYYMQIENRRKGELRGTTKWENERKQDRIYERNHHLFTKKKI